MTAYSKRKYSVCDESEENYREGNEPDTHAL